MERSALKTYGTQQVMTATPVELVALLYDKAIVSLREAAEAIEAGDINRRWRCNNKATEIVTHLAKTLDHEKGGEVARNLEQLYRYMLDRLFQVDMKNDAGAALDVIGLLEPLRDSWRQLAERAPEPAGKSAEQSAGKPAGQTAVQGQGHATGQAGGYGATPARPAGSGGNAGYAGAPAPDALREALNISA